LFCGYPVY